MPEMAAKIVAQWIVDSKCLFKITRSRSTKLGDYRAPYAGQGHRISVNHDLNPYAFLVTTIHEFAHLQTWNKYQHRVKPHGQEWKKTFRELMEPFLALEIFPTAIRVAISQYLENPAASSCTDMNLYRALRQYDPPNDKVTVETLPVDSIFKLPNGRVFQKKEQIRKRFRCIELASNRIYLFNPIAEVLLLDNVED